MSDPQVEWLEWTEEVAGEREDAARAVAAFTSLDNAAGREAARWLREDAAGAYPATVTRLLLAEGAVQGFYSLSMGAVELSTSHQRVASVTHPRQGAVLITWLARSSTPALESVTELLLRHAVGIGRRAARDVGATVLALDPFDEATAALWQERWRFRRSRTQLPGKPHRLWQPLFPH